MAARPFCDAAGAICPNFAAFTVACRVLISLLSVFMGGFVDWVHQVVEAEDADDIPQRLKSKEVKLVDYNISSDDPFSFLFGLTLTFQRRKARGLDATLALVIEDKGPLPATIRVRSSRVEVEFKAPEKADAELRLTWATLRRIFRDGVTVEEAVARHGATLTRDAATAQAIRRCFPVYRVPVEA